MWKHRLERRSPRNLSPAVERELRRRRDGFWGVERVLRSIVSTWIDDPGEWFDCLERWANRQPDPVRTWTLLEIVILDWIQDDGVSESIRSELKSLIVRVRENG